MKITSLGCISPLGFVLVLIILFAIGAVSGTRGGVLFSSGPLNARVGDVLGGVSSHADLEGQCKQCHPAPWSGERMSERCLVCHTSIAAEMDDPKALHGILWRTNQEMDCRICHTEHNGPDAPLTFLELTTFPHDLVGFSLAAHSDFTEGKPVECQDCHAETLTDINQEVCTSCHASLNPEIEEAHFAVFGVDCLACHDGVDTYGKGFDHASTGFALLGTHVDTACKECHPGAASLEMLAAAPKDCFSCHEEEDPHRGRLSQNCGVCHTPVGWEETTFDHAVTGFTLVGQHTQVECEACHPNESYEGTPETCVGCHAEDNPHDERYGTDCGLCHTPIGWEDVQFDHTTIDATDCEACHERPAGHYPGQCSTCHTTDAWEPALFDHEAAGATDCQSCHTRPQGHYPGQCSACHSTDAWEPAHFDHAAAGATDCQSCHTRPEGHYPGQCSACHSTDAWEPAHFDHAAAGATDCQACHAPPANHYSGQCSACHSTSSWAFVHSTGTDCQACHNRPSEHPGGQCSDCHNTSNWDDAEGEDEFNDDDDD